MTPDDFISENYDDAAVYLSGDVVTFFDGVESEEYALAEWDAVEIPASATYDTLVHFLPEPLRRVAGETK